MRFTPLLALGLGNVALAQNSTTLSWSPTSSPVSAQSTSPAKPNAFPAQLGDYQFYGCVSSSAGFPTFTMTASSQDMGLDFCAASCPSRFFGVSGSDCYCGEEIDNSNTQRVANTQCTTPCPGDDSQYCGGMAGSLRMARRQSVPLSVLLTVYVRVADADQAPGGVTASASPGVTSTITSTSTGTVTSCAPEVPDCPVGQPTVTTITSTFCPEPEPTHDHHKVIICYGDYCVSPQPCHEEQCTKHRVVCDSDICRPEECHADDEHWNQIVQCNGEDCHYPQCNGEDCQKKVVCYGDKCIHEKCYDDECHKKLVCHGDECKHEACDGDDCHNKVICDGEECKPQPPCDGPDCPVPPPPGPVPPPTPGPIPTGGPVPPVNPVPPGSPEPPVAGSGKMTPAFGIGAIAGLAFFI